MSPDVRLLGATTFQRSDGTVVGAEAVATSKALDLLRLLVVAGDELRTADYYIDVLWPATDHARGRMSLRTALAQLRRVLGPDVVQRSGDLLSLGEVTTDVADLRDGAAWVEVLNAAGHDDEVVRVVCSMELSHGADLVVTDSSCEAVYAARDSLRELRCRNLLAGAAAAGRLGRANVSLDLAQRADELISSEASVRALMTAWAMLGETERVVETFERLRTRLDEEYGVQPSPASRALYLQVVAPQSGATQEEVEHHPDVAIEVAATILQLAERRPPGGVVWVHGEPGAGRASVARQAVRLLEQSAPCVAISVDVLPDFVGLDQDAADQVRRDAVDRGAVLLVPIRHELLSRGSAQEAHVEVGRLTRPDFHDLLRRLLQEEPSPALEKRLWAITGGLAGHTCRTVGRLVRDGGLRWMPGSVDLGSLQASR